MLAQISAGIFLAAPSWRLVGCLTIPGRRQRGCGLLEDLVNLVGGVQQDVGLHGFEVDAVSQVVAASSVRRTEGDVSHGLLLFDRRVVRVGHSRHVRQTETNFVQIKIRFSF